MYESFDSVKTLSLMSDITAAEEKLNDVNREINKIVQDKETHDITSLTKLGRLSHCDIPSGTVGSCRLSLSTIPNLLSQDRLSIYIDQICVKMTRTVS